MELSAPASTVLLPGLERGDSGPPFLQDLPWPRVLEGCFKPQLCHHTHAFGGGSEIQRERQGVPKCAGKTQELCGSIPKIGFLASKWTSKIAGERKSNEDPSASEVEGFFHRFFQLFCLVLFEGVLWVVVVVLVWLF